MSVLTEIDYRNIFSVLNPLLHDIICIFKSLKLQDHYVIFLLKFEMILIKIPQNYCTSECKNHYCIFSFLF